MGNEREAVRGAWRRFVQSGRIEAEAVRPVVLESWARSRAAGVHAEQASFVRVSEDDLAARLERDRALVESARVELAAVRAILADVPHVVYLVDREGVVLLVDGTSMDIVEQAGLVPGYDWSERRMGTNGAGTALATGAPVAVVGCEHYCTTWHEATCVAAPIRDASGAVVGAVDLTTHVDDGTPDRLALVQLAAAHVGRALERASPPPGPARATPASAGARVDRYDVLADAARVLGPSPAGLEAALGVLAPRLAGALGDGAFASLLDDDGAALRCVAAAHVDAAAAEAARGTVGQREPVAFGTIHDVLASGRSARMVVDGAARLELRGAAAQRYVDARRPAAYLFAPIVVEGRAAGMLACVRDAGGRPYDGGDERLLADIAHLVACAIARERALQAARTSDHARERFVAGLAHEAKQPLSALRLHVDALVRFAQRGDGRKVSETAAQAARCITRLARTVDDLAELSSATTGRLQLEREAVDLAALVEEAFEELADRVVALRARVRLACDEPVVEGEWDRARLRRAIRGLVLELLERGAWTVEVRLTPADATVGLAFVGDGAGGVAPAAIGLDAAIARAVFAAHGGALLADGSSGDRARVVVELPRRAPT